MNINQTIISTITPICPVAFHEYTGDSTTYITFHSPGQQSAMIAEDLERKTAHTVQLDIYSKGNINSLAKQTKALLKPYGKTKDANGVMIDSANDEAPFFALGFKAKKSNGESRLVWLYKGKFSAVEENFATQQDKADFQTQPISGTFIKRQDGKWRARVDSDDAGLGLNVAEQWFTAPYETVPAV